MNPIRVTFSTPPDDHGWPPAPFERVWAIEVGPRTAKIDNVPFFTKEATLDDIVEVRPEDDGTLAFVRVVEPSEHSLVRVLLHERPKFDRLQTHLMNLGCVVEGHAARLMLAVSIPRTTNIRVVMNHLVQLEAKGILEYEEAILRIP